MTDGLPNVVGDAELDRLRAAEETCWSLFLAIGLGTMESVSTEVREHLMEGGFDRWTRLCVEQGLMDEEEPDEEPSVIREQELLDRGVAMLADAGIEVRRSDIGHVLDNLAADWVNKSKPEAKTADQETPDDGHTFRILYTSRGSYSIVGDEHHTDAPGGFYDPYHVVEVRAWSLKDALLKAADLPFSVLIGTELIGQPVDVIEPTPEPDPDVSEGRVYDWLMMVKDEIPGKRMPSGSEILKWDQPTRQEVMGWAVAIHLVASDNDDVVIPPVPAVLQPPAAPGGGTTLLSRCTCRGGPHGGYTCPGCR